jgi:hypothetical protein
MEAKQHDFEKEEHQAKYDKEDVYDIIHRTH